MQLLYRTRDIRYRYTGKRKRARKKERTRGKKGKERKIGERAWYMAEKRAFGRRCYSRRRLKSVSARRKERERKEKAEDNSTRG